MKKFEVGKTYTCKGTAIGDFRTWEFTVTKRTAKTITFVDSLDEQFTRKVQGEEVEWCKPYADDPTESNVLLYADSRPY